MAVPKKQKSSRLVRIKKQNIIFSNISKLKNKKLFIALKIKNNILF